MNDLNTKTESEDKKEIIRLKELLKDIIRDVEEWCDAVSEDSSWDGWDSHYKTMKYKSLSYFKEQIK